MSTKYYAVKKGLNEGIFADWESCRASVEGFPGAEYKSFRTIDEAVAYIEGYETGILPEKEDDGPHPEPKTAIAYVDGSFKEGISRFAYGVVMFIGEEDGSCRQLRLSKAFSNPELLRMRNVAGEIMGAGEAMKQARDAGLRSLTIYHDYEGIAKWCLGEWKTNTVWTKKYKAFYDEISRSLKVSFVKVRGHSGDRYNDIADELAKAALTTV